MTDADIIAAVKEWAVERIARDRSEEVLLATLASVYPDEIHTVERCDCGEPCGECPTEAYVQSWIAQVLKP